MKKAEAPRTVTLTFLHGGEPETRSGPPAILAEWLARRFPEVVAEVEPGASLEDLIEHLRQRIQSYEVELFDED